MLSLLLGPSFVVVVVVAVYILRCLSSPLNKIPGPPLARYTSLILKWHEFHTDRRKYIHNLHLRYGPVVRIAPNEVAFSSLAAVKEIYCSAGSGYDKTEFYDLFKVYGRRYLYLIVGNPSVVLC
jgi:hypothetical protein